MNKACVLAQGFDFTPILAPRPGLEPHHRSVDVKVDCSRIDANPPQSGHSQPLAQLPPQGGK